MTSAEVLERDSPAMCRALFSVCELLHEIGDYLSRSCELYDELDLLGREAARKGSAILDMSSEAFESEEIYEMLWFCLMEVIRGEVGWPDTEVMAESEAEDIYLALLVVTQHASVARELKILVDLDMLSESGQDWYRKESSNSLWVFVETGKILLEFEGLDPQMQIAGPGVSSYLARSDNGAFIVCADMTSEIKATLTRASRERDGLAPCVASQGRDATR